MEDNENNVNLEEGIESSSSSDSDDSSASMNEDEDEEMLSRLGKINLELSNQPLSYDLLSEKIQVLKSLGELKELRSVRELMSKTYPLTPLIWLSWIEDEISLAGNLEEKKDLIILFERALKDYQSVDVWMKYVEFIKENIDSSGTEETFSIDKLRKTLERALGAVGVHFTKAHLLWDFYRSVELDEKNPRKLTEVSSRQMSIPMRGLEDSYKSIKAQEILLDEIAEANYNKSLKLAKELEIWETKLTESNCSAEGYKELIEYEKSINSNPSRIICIYERSVTDQPLDPSLWSDFINYCSSELNIGEVTLEVAERSVRNITWNADLWISLLEQVEKFTNDKLKIKEAFERGIACCSTGDDAGRLWLKYLQFLRRSIDLNSIVEENVSLFKKTLTAAEDYLSKLSPEPRDIIGEILMFDIRTTAHLTKSMSKSKKLWIQALRKGYGQKFKYWIQYYNLELKYGDIKSLRKCLEKGLNHSEEDLSSINLISSLWLNFERDFGDLSSMKQAEDEINKKLSNPNLYEIAKRPQNQFAPRNNKFKNLKRTNPHSSPKFEQFNNKRRRENENNSSKTSEEPSGSSNSTNSSFNFRKPGKVFIPRSVLKKEPNKTEDSTPAADTKDKKLMTNDDFRNFFKK